MSKRRTRYEQCEYVEYSSPVVVSESTLERRLALASERRKSSAAQRRPATPARSNARKIRARERNAVAVARRDTSREHSSEPSGRA